LLRPIQADNHPFETFLLPPIEFLAACNPSLELGDTETLDIRSLGSHPLLLDTSFYVRTTFDAACRIAGLRPNIYMESRTPHALLALAETGHGVAIVPSVLPTHRYRLRIVRLTYRGKSLREPMTIMWDKRRALPAYAEDFCQALAAYMREIYRSRGRRRRGLAGAGRRRLRRRSKRFIPPCQAAPVGRSSRHPRPRGADVDPRHRSTLLKTG
jgi:DNA-binding transcriptional LysR family regulator